MGRVLPVVRLLSTEPRRFTMMDTACPMCPLLWVDRMPFLSVALWSQVGHRFCLVRAPEQFLSFQNFIGRDRATPFVKLEQDVASPLRHDPQNALECCRLCHSMMHQMHNFCGGRLFHCSTKDGAARCLVDYSMWITATRARLCTLRHALLLVLHWGHLTSTSSCK